MRGFLVPALVLALAGGRLRADDAVPAYEVPAGFEAPKLPEALDAAARAAVATILDPPSPDAGEDAARVLAGLGRGALPHVVGGLAGAGWYARAALVSAAAEMGAPDATPLFVAACRDPAFAVREAAVSGLGKSGDARGAAALAERADPRTEHAWRVRAAAATALRRAVLRGTIDRAAGEAALVLLLGDADDDARRAALREIAPLAATAALPPLLDVFADPETQRPDRNLALAALRAYRSPTPELLAALRRGFLAGDDPAEATEAGRALLAMRGVTALDDAEVSEALVHGLHESEHAALREGLARLGRPAAPWLRARALDLASRIAAGRGSGHETFTELLDTLIQVDETAGLSLLKELLTGRDAGTLDRETRLAAVRKVELAYAPRLAAELRVLFDSPAGADIRAEVLRSIVASGGEDLAQRLDAALAAEKRSVRAAALELLDRRPDLDAGENLLAMARGAPDPNDRRAAIETLSRRDLDSDREEAARIAAGLLDDPRAELRSKAVTVLSASRDPADFERLLARLGKEDGSDVAPPKPTDGDGGRSAAGTTPSERVVDVGASRRRLVRALLLALRTTGGERARPTLLRFAASDADALIREAAARGLRGIATDADAPRLLACESAESDPAVRREILRTLACLGGAPQAVARFDTLVGDTRTRSDALALLKEPGASVLPASVAAGLAGTDWTEDDRCAALVVLDRAGRAPDAAALAALVGRARTLDLCSEAARILSSRKEPEAGTLFVGLLGSVEDPAKLAIVVQSLGARGAPEAEAPLLGLFAEARDRALAATVVSDPAVELYWRCADAVAEFGSERTGEALAAHLLDPRLAHAAARCAVDAGGPFRPEEAAPVKILRTLVGAFARRDEAACRRLLESHLGAAAANGLDVALPERFVAGVARYLQTPLAYGLPARPRPAAAHVLWDLVVRAAPRMSASDVLAHLAADDVLGQAGRYREAADALRAYVALADVEDAARSAEDRLVEDCRIAARTAQALAAEGRADDALALARSLRERDATSGELAYRQGWCLARIGRAGPEARDALLFAAAQDDRDARIHFWLGWVAEQTDGPERALPAYDQAVLLDRRRVQERAGDDASGSSGAPYEAAAYPYWLARALKRAGHADAAGGWLAAAVALDDRLAADARRDAAFAGWDRLEPALAEGLAKIRLRGPRQPN